MSQALHETVDVHHAAFDDHQYPPQSARNQEPQGFSNFVDGSGPIFSMYMEMATEEDKKMTENWKADADGILIFTGLFSAAVASLISVSIQDIQQSPQDVSNFYLANTYKATINPNLSSSLPTEPPPFSPPNYAIWVNALWFWSLVISLTCALLATFLQQWARRYLKVTQSRYSPHKRARIRAFFAEGVKECVLPFVVEILPTLLHISLFLFFAGLVVFLSNVNLTIFKLVLSWASICVALYGCVTLMPIFRHDSPYYTSMSSLVWSIVMGIAIFVSVFCGKLLFLGRHRARWFLNFVDPCDDMLFDGMHKTVEETALKSPSEIDARAFIWTFESLDEDHELERFFAGLPGFRSSKVVQDPLPDLPFGEMDVLSEALAGLLDRTLSSDLLPEFVKKRRIMICMKALDLEHIPGAFFILEKTLFRLQHSGPLATGIVEILRGWRKCGDEATATKAQAYIFQIVVRMQPRDDSWFLLASEELGVPEAVLRDHTADGLGDSLSLAILIHFIHQQFSHFAERSWPAYMFSFVLLAASNLDHVQNTSPELQHTFCALWNQIVCKVQNDNNRDMTRLILGMIRNVYVVLHQDTNSSPTQFSASTTDFSEILAHPSSYPVCTVPGHHPDSVSHIHDDSAPTASAGAIIPHDRTLDVPSWFAHAPLRVDESFADALLLDDHISVPISESLQPTDQTTDTHHFPSTSSNPITAPTHTRVDTSVRTMHLFTPEPSASPPPSTGKSKTSTSPPDVIVDEHHTASDDPDLNVPSSVSPALVQVLDNIVLAETLIARSTDRSSGLSAAAEGEDNAIASLAEDIEMDILHEDLMVTPDMPSESSPPRPVGDVATAGVPRNSLDVEQTEGEHPSHTCGQYDNV